MMHISSDLGSQGVLYIRAIHHLTMIHIIYTLVCDGRGCHFASNHDVTLPFFTT